MAVGVVGQCLGWDRELAALGGVALDEAVAVVGVGAEAAFALAVVGWGVRGVERGALQALLRSARLSRRRTLKSDSASQRGLP